MSRVKNNSGHAFSPFTHLDKYYTRCVLTPHVPRYLSDSFPFPSILFFPPLIQPREGVEEGPIRLVEFGLIDQLKSMGWTVEFEGHRDYAALRPTSDPDSGKLKRPRYVSVVTKAVSKQVEAHARRGNMVLTLGGDHSIAIGTVTGVFAAYPDACLIWVDAHAVSWIYRRFGSGLKTLNVLQ